MNRPVNDHDREVDLRGERVWLSDLVSVARDELDRDARIERLSADYAARFPGKPSIREMLEGMQPKNPKMEALARRIVDEWGHLFPVESPR
jgi:hypothetical protein